MRDSTHLSSLQSSFQRGLQLNGAVGLLEGDPVKLQLSCDPWLCSSTDTSPRSVLAKKQSYFRNRLPRNAACFDAILAVCEDTRSNWFWRLRAAEIHFSQFEENR